MLKRVSIQNFKSLKDVTLDLQKVNLLIGPNNSGKTNFLKALEFCQNIKDYKQVGLEAPLGEESALERIIFKQNADNTLSINLAIDGVKSNSGENAELRFEITSEFTWYLVGFKIIQGPFNIGSTQDLKKLLGESLLYKPDPNKYVEPAPIGNKEESISADASNLVGFLDLMLGKYRRTVFNRIEKDLNTCIPEFDEISLDDVPSTDELKKQFGDKSFKRIGLTNSKQGITYWADELSEGTLYFLALLCIINQPNPPKLLLLEEPEKGIHPRRIREVIQFILRLVEEKDIQVIMTTHSPIVLDMFAEMPESVFIFDKDDEGATYVKNLQRDVIEPDIEKSKELGIEPPHYTDALGDSWTIGFLGGVPK